MTVERHERVEPLAAEWDELADRTAAPPWLRPSWTESWWRAFGRGSLEILAARRDGRLVGVLPLGRHAGALAATANWHTPEWGPVAEDGGARAALARELFARPPRSVRLAFVDPDRLGELRDAASAAGCRILERTLMRSPYVQVAGVEEPGTIDRKRRKELERSRRRLEEQGALTVEVEDGSARLDELLEEGFRIEGSGWKHETGTAIDASPETLRFYREVVRAAADRGVLRLLFLRLDGRPVSFELLLEDGGRFYNLKGGYDVEFRRFAPGMLSVREMLRLARERGLESYEFLGSDDAYKLEWTDTLRERRELRAFAPTAAGLAEWAAYAHGRPLAKRLLRR